MTLILRLKIQAFQLPPSSRLRITRLARSNQPQRKPVSSIRMPFNHRMSQRSLWRSLPISQITDLNSLIHRRNPQMIFRIHLRMNFRMACRTRQNLPLLINRNRTPLAGPTSLRSSQRQHLQRTNLVMNRRLIFLNQQPAINQA